MSRIGKKIIIVPEGVNVDVAADNTVTVTGPKGTLTRQFSNLITKINKNITVTVEGNEVKLTRKNDNFKNFHGTANANIKNMIIGVSEGFEKKLEIVGIGYRAQMQGNKLVMNIGYSHPVEVEIEEGVKVECPSATEITVSGISKERVGHVASVIRAWKKPEPYKGKGIKYSDEHIIRKEGKTAGKK